MNRKEKKLTKDLYESICESCDEKDLEVSYIYHYGNHKYDSKIKITFVDDKEYVYLEPLSTKQMRYYNINMEKVIKSLNWKLYYYDNHTNTKITKCIQYYVKIMSDDALALILSLSIPLATMMILTKQGLFRLYVLPLLFILMIIIGLLVHWLIEEIYDLFLG